MKQSIKNYLKNIALAAGQIVNTIAAGSPHETVSSRIYRCAVLADSPTIAARAAYRTVNTVYFWQEDHCQAAWVAQKENSPESLK